MPDVQATLKMIVIHCLPFDSLCEDVLEIIKNKKEPIHSKVGLTEFIQVWNPTKLFLSYSGYQVISLCVGCVDQCTGKS